MEKTAREQLLDAATILFSEEGFSAVSLSRVAAKSGIEAAEIGLLFGNLEKLYEIVLESQFSRYAERMSAVFGEEDNPINKIELFAKAICDFHKDAPCFFPLYYRELLNPSVHFESIVLKNIRHVAYLADNNIAKGIQKGTFKYEINPANGTMFLVGMLHYYFLAKRIVGSLLPETISDEEYISQALSVYFNGLKLEAGSEPEGGDSKAERRN